MTSLGSNAVNASSRLLADSMPARPEEANAAAPLKKDAVSAAGKAPLTGAGSAAVGKCASSGVGGKLTSSGADKPPVVPSLVKASPRTGHW